MADINDKILQAAEKNLKALGNALGKTVGAALEADNAANATNLYLQLTDVKDSFTKIYGKLKNIPDEVYTEIAKTLINEIDSIIFTKYSSDKSELIKQIGNQIGKIFTKIDDQKITVDGTTYKISFKGSRLGLKGKFIRVSDGNKELWLNWKSESYGKKILAQYVVSLFNLDKYLGEETLAKFVKLVSSNGFELFSVILKDDITQSALKKVLGSKLFKAIGGEKVQSKIEETLLSVSDSKVYNALMTYVELNNAYKNLAAEIDDVKTGNGDIQSLSEAFTNTATTLRNSLESLGINVDLEVLPDIFDGLTYNKNNTAVTISAGYTNELETSDYKSTVKKIYAKSLTESIIINGNDKNNIIYGGKGNDTIIGGAGADKLYGNSGNDILVGGKGNDSLWGGTGADNFIYDTGDGKDVIFGFDSKDTLTLDSLDFKAAYKNGAVTFTTDGGSVTLKDFTATTFHVNNDIYKISGSKFKKQT